MFTLSEIIDANGNPNDYPTYVGSQGDVRYAFNHVLAVRDIEELLNNSIH